MLTRRQATTAVIATCALPSLIRHAAAQEGRSALNLIDATPGVSIFAEIIRNHKLEEHFTTGRHGYFVPTNQAIENFPRSALSGCAAIRRLRGRRSSTMSPTSRE